MPGCFSCSATVTTKPMTFVDVIRQKRYLKIGVDWTDVFDSCVFKVSWTKLVTRTVPDTLAPNCFDRQKSPSLYKTSKRCKNRPEWNRFALFRWICSFNFGEFAFVAIFNLCFKKHTDLFKKTYCSDSEIRCSPIGFSIVTLGMVSKRGGKIEEAFVSKVFCALLNWAAIDACNRPFKMFCCPWACCCWSNCK